VEELPVDGSFRVPPRASKWIYFLGNSGEGSHENESKVAVNISILACPLEKGFEEEWQVNEGRGEYRPGPQR